MLFFLELSTKKALATNYTISKIVISQEYNINFKKKNVIDKAFKKAFIMLVGRLVESKDYKIFQKIEIDEIKSLINNFSVTNEKFMNNEYITEVEVEFDRKKVLNFIQSKNVISSIPKNINLLIIPIVIDTVKDEIYYINNNIFFKEWLNVNEDYHLINYSLPNQDIEDFQIIKKNVKNLERNNLKEIMDKYNFDNFALLIIYKTEKNLRVFSRINFNSSEFTINNTYFNTEINDLDSVRQLISKTKKEYEDKFKLLNKINISVNLSILFSLDSKEYEKINKFEKFLINQELISNYKIKSISNKNVLYQVTYNGNPEKFLKSLNQNDFEINSSSTIWIVK